MIIFEIIKALQIHPALKCGAVSRYTESATRYLIILMLVFAVASICSIHGECTTNQEYQCHQYPDSEILYLAMTIMILDFFCFTALCIWLRKYYHSKIIAGKISNVPSGWIVRLWNFSSLSMMICAADLWVHDLYAVDPSNSRFVSFVFLLDVNCLALFNWWMTKYQARLDSDFAEKEDSESTSFSLYSRSWSSINVSSRDCHVKDYLSTCNVQYRLELEDAFESTEFEIAGGLNTSFY